MLDFVTRGRFSVVVLGLSSRVVLVEDDMGRLAEVVEGRLDPAAAVEGALDVVVFLSVV